MNNIKILLQEKDNIEKIRDQIVYILKSECMNQYTLAAELRTADVRDYKIGIYLESERPWQMTEYEESKNLFPLVNITLLDTRQAEKPGGTVSEKKYIAQFALDCYGCGNRSISGDNENSQLAALQAWKAARVVRNILMAGCYTYLGMQSIVKLREITAMESGSQSNRFTNSSSLSVTICRIILQVTYTEGSPQIAPVDMEEISFISISDTGEVLIDI